MNKLTKALAMIMSIFCLASCGSKTFTAEEEFRYIYGTTFNDSYPEDEEVKQYAEYYYCEVDYDAQTDTLKALMPEGYWITDIHNGYNIRENDSLTKDIIELVYQEGMQYTNGSWADHATHLVFKDVYLTKDTYYRLINCYDFMLYKDKVGK